MMGSPMGLQGTSFLTTLTGALGQFSSVIPLGTIGTKVLGFLTGLSSLGGFTGGLSGLTQSANLTSLLGSNGTAFLSSFQTLMNSMSGSSFTSVFSYLQNVLTLLGNQATAPGSIGNLNNVGFLSGLIGQLGSSGAQLQPILDNASALLNELQGLQKIFSTGNLSTSDKITVLSNYISDLNMMGLLLNPNVTGLTGAQNTITMLQTLNAFGA